MLLLMLLQLLLSLAYDYKHDETCQAEWGKKDWGKGKRVYSVGNETFRSREEGTVLCSSFCKRIFCTIRTRRDFKIYHRSFFWLTRFYPICTYLVKSSRVCNYAPNLSRNYQSFFKKLIGVFYLRVDVCVVIVSGFREVRPVEVVAPVPKGGSRALLIRVVNRRIGEVGGAVRGHSREKHLQ